MTEICVCCGSTEAPKPHLPGLVQCAGCSHVWAQASLTDDEIRKLYGQNYFEGEEYLDYGREEPALRRNFRHRLKVLAKLQPQGANLWEIGAAFGFFLSEASGHFRVAGCDISTYAAERARESYGIDIRVGDYLDIDLEPHDVICLWDVIEHLPSPQYVLQKAHRDLRHKGTLVLSTGDMGSFVARLFGRHWRLIHVPTHLHYFTRASMTTLLRRLGFSEIRVHYHAFWRSADAAVYRLLAHDGTTVGKHLYEILHRVGALGFLFPLNTFDIMTVYATKPGGSYASE